MGDNGRASKAEQAFLDLVKRYPCMLQPAAFAVAAKLLKGATRGYSQDNLAANAISGAGPVPLRRFSFQITVTYKSFLGVHLRKPLSRKVQRRWRCTLTVHVCTAEEEYDAVAGGARRPLPTLMFAHGMGGCKDEAEPFVVGLCGHGVAVVSIDQPGHGNAPPQPYVCTTLGAVESETLAIVAKALCSSAPGRPQVASSLGIITNSAGGLAAFKALPRLLELQLPITLQISDSAPCDLRELAVFLLAKDAPEELEKLFKADQDLRREFLELLANEMKQLSGTDVLGLGTLKGLGLKEALEAARERGAGVEVLTGAAENDKMVPASQAELLRKLLPASVATHVNFGPDTSHTSRRPVAWHRAQVRSINRALGLRMTADDEARAVDVLQHWVDPPVHHCTVFSAQQAQQLWQEEGAAGGGEPWLIRNYGGTAAAKMFGGARAGSAASDLEQLSEGAFVWAGIKGTVMRGAVKVGSSVRACLAKLTTRVQGL